MVPGLRHDQKQPIFIVDNILYNIYQYHIILISQTSRLEFCEIRVSKNTGEKENCLEGLCHL